MRKIISLIFVIASCLLLFYAKQFAITSILIAALAVLLFFLSFEKRFPEAKELVLIAVMTALTVASRILFAPLAFVKPVAALIIISALVFGKETGFMIGALTALLSNMYFGQGIWTPFMMLSWGLIGYMAGLMGRFRIMERPLAISVLGAFCGLFYSVMNDLQTLLFFGDVTWKRWLAITVSALPVTATYVVSNFLFLLVLSPTLLTELHRITMKYGFFR